MTKKKLDSILSKSQFPWWEWDLTKDSVAHNALKVTMLGYDMSDFKNAGYKDFTKLIHPDDFSQTMQAMRDVIEKKTKLYQTEYRIKTKHGKYKWFMDRGYVTEEDDRGNPTVIRGIVIDLGDEEKKDRNTEALISLIHNSIEKLPQGEISVLTVCANCRKVKHNSVQWIELSSDLFHLLGEKISHGLCPDCINKLYPDIAESVQKAIS